MQLSNNFCTTAEASRLLGLSVGAVRNMVAMGKLKAHRTHGGHRRISRKSLNECMVVNSCAKASGQIKYIAVFHHGDDMRPIFAHEQDGCIVRMMHHPLDILSLHSDCDLLLIDARLDWFKGVAIHLCTRLVGRFKVFIYNSQNLSKDVIALSHTNLRFIEGGVDSSWLFGFLRGQKVGRW